MDYLIWIVRISLQPLAFFIWALELEIETLFIDKERGQFRQRFNLFLSKFGTRCVFLIVGGYHASRLQLLARNNQKTQDKVLRRIIRESRKTAYARDHDFCNIRSYEDFKSKVPLQTYAEHKPYIDRQMKGERDVLVPGRPLRYATTSGTTGQPKYIPVTAKAARLSHRNVSLIWCYYLARRSIGFLDDSILAIAGSPVEGWAEDGTPFGSASGQLQAGMPKFMRKVYAVPPEVFSIEDYESRYYCLALFSLKTQISHIISANPSTLVLVFEAIEKNREKLIEDIEKGTLNGQLRLSPKQFDRLQSFTKPDPGRATELRCAIHVAGRMNPAYYWPRLTSIACWKGGNSPIFIEKLRRMIPESITIFDLGYLASEIRASVPIERHHHGGIPTFHRNFFEFVRVDQWEQGSRQTLRLHELELAESYYVIITTDCGLYRYQINDIVRVVGFFCGTPELSFEQKGEGVTSLTGEKLYEQQVQIAISKAVADHGISLHFYLCLLNKDSSCYEFLIETSENQTWFEDSALRFLASIDRELEEVNVEYKAKRRSLRLLAPVIHILKEGSFENYRTRRVESGVREAQFKMILLSPKYEMINEFEIKSTFTFSKEDPNESTRG